MKEILDNNNIVESYPGISLPLTVSFVKQAYHGVFRGVVKRITQNDRMVEELNDEISKMVDSYNGRIYYRLNSWYAVLSLLLFSGKLIKIWQRMLGIDSKQIIFNKPKVSFAQKIIIALSGLKSLKTVSREMEDLNRHFLTVEKEFRAKNLSILTNDELKDLYYLLDTKLMGRWEVTLTNDMYAFIYTYLAEKSIKDAKKYITNITNLESMKPVQELFKMAEEFKKNGAIKEIAQIKDDQSAFDYLSKQSKNQKTIKKFIEKYGDRYLEELKLESATYRTNPVLLMRKIVEFTQSLSEGRKLSLEESHKLPNVGPRKLRYLKKAMLGIKNREVSRLNRSRLYGMVRDIFLQLGNNYYNDNLIDNPNDIFWLTVDEALNLKGKNDIKSKIVERKTAYETYQEVTPVSRIIIEDNKVSEQKEKHPTDLSGTPVSSGNITAEALVVADPKKVKNARGKILVTKTTDPGWVFLIVQAKGLIAEKGSLLSHTAIISRELGIPAIVGVKGATSKLSSGDIIEMNCDTGLIEVNKNANKATK